MAFIKDIIINIAKGTKGLAKKVFRPLIVGSDTVEIAVGIYAELTDLISAGYTDTDPEYLQMAAMLAQSPRPVDVAVYRSPGKGWRGDSKRLFICLLPGPGFACRA